MALCLCEASGVMAFCTSTDKEPGPNSGRRSNLTRTRIRTASSRRHLYLLRRRSLRPRRTAPASPLCRASASSLGGARRVAASSGRSRSPCGCVADCRLRPRTTRRRRRPCQRSARVAEHVVVVAREDCPGCAVTNDDDQIIGGAPRTSRLQSRRGRARTLQAAWYRANAHLNDGEKAVPSSTSASRSSLPEPGADLPRRLRHSRFTERVVAG